MTIASAARRSIRFRRRQDREQVGVAENAGQQVVEVVRDAAGQHHQAFALLLFLHAPLERIALRLVAAADSRRRESTTSQPTKRRWASRTADTFTSKYRGPGSTLTIAGWPSPSGRPSATASCPPRDHFFDRPAKAGHRHAGVALGGGVQIDEAPLRVEHDHAVVHAVDDHVARDGHQAEQAVAIDAAGEARARHRERHRRRSRPAGGTRDEIQEVADPRHDRADDDQRGLPAVRRREAAQAAHQRERADQQQEVAVAGVHPVPRAAAIHEPRACRRRDFGDRRPVQRVAARWSTTSSERDGRHDPDQHAQQAIAGPRHAAVLGREEQPQHADRRDAEILELRR